MRLQDRIIQQVMSEVESEKAEMERKAESIPADPAAFVAHVLSTGPLSAARWSDINLMFALFFARHVDNFQSFIEDLLSAIFTAKPEFVETVQYKKIASLKTRTERVNSYLDWLARQNLAKVRNELNEHAGFELFPNAQAAASAQLISDVRNLITHRYGVVDSFFKEHHPTCPVQVGQPFPIDQNFVAKSVQALIAATVDIEKRARASFRLGA